MMDDDAHGSGARALLAEERLIRQAVVAGVVPADVAAQAVTPRPDGPAPLEFLIARSVLTREQVELLRMLTRTEDTSRTIGSYQLIEVIGKGGMGVVYRGVHAVLERQAAVKVLLPLLAEDRDFQERFLREAKAAAGISHPNVVSCYDAGRDGDRLFLAMELLPKGDVESLMRKHGGSLPERLALEICRDAACGLEAVERAGLVHRDIKPANILLAADGSAKIGDLGLARPMLDDARITKHGGIAGTPAFMAPEQVRGGAEVDIRADLYALAATLFCMLTGMPPITGSAAAVIASALKGQAVPDPRALAQQVGARTAAIIARAGAARPDERFQRPGELRAAIEAALRDPDTRSTLRSPVPAVRTAPTVLLPDAARDVLVVADRPDAAAAYGRAVPDPSVRVRVVATLDEAQAEARRAPPAAIVVDVPDSGGAAARLRERLRDEPALARIAVVDVESARAGSAAAEPFAALDADRRASLALASLATALPGDPLARLTPATYRLEGGIAPDGGRSRALEHIAQAANWAAELRATTGSQSSSHIKLIADTLRPIVTGSATTRPDVALLAETAEAFLRHLHLWPEHVTPSAIRTIHQALAQTERLLKARPARPVGELRALALDDDPISLQAMQLAMQKVGLACASAAEGEAALEIAAREPIDIVLSDVLMPTMDGHEFVQRLRRLPGYASTPVIFVTTLDSAVQTLRVGAQVSNDVIIKPFLFMELATKALAHCLAAGPAQ